MMLVRERTSLRARVFITVSALGLTLWLVGGCSRSAQDKTAHSPELSSAVDDEPVGQASQPVDQPMAGAAMSIAPPPDLQPPSDVGMSSRSAPPLSAPAPEMMLRAEARAMQAEPFSTLPAGSTASAENGFATVQVYYATDRRRDVVTLSDLAISGHKDVFVLVGAGAMICFAVALFSWVRGSRRLGNVMTLVGGICSCLAVVWIVSGRATIEKHGVTYTGERGVLTRGICEITVPNIHQRGIVERPSLLRFEMREDQREHIVLTSAVELSERDFHQRLSETVSQSPAGDLLVFIHGYNVDFQSAIRRTAQIAIDLPFEGVPVCYSWPSQGTLMGYPIDESNAEWTETHLRDFLVELVRESGARSINVVAHSMGNRPMTAAMRQIYWEIDALNAPLFDRIVLAAPDVDADRFRRDLAPALFNIANQVTLYASSSDQALIASKQVHGYPRAGESGPNVVVVPGVETIDVSGIDLSLLGHSYYGDNESMLHDLYEVVRSRLPAPRRALLMARQQGELIYWQLSQRPNTLPDAVIR